MLALLATVDDGLLVLLAEDGCRFTVDDFGVGARFFLDTFRSTADKNVDNLRGIGVCRLTTCG